jgi:lipopolysaccharide transport system permease protein
MAGVEQVMDAPADQPAPGPGWVIEPRREGFVARIRDVWRYRRLLRFFAKKSFEKLYARTMLGWSWVLIRPLFPLVVSTFVFGGVLGVGSQGVPYFLFLVVGSATWDLFSQATTWGTRSLEMNRSFLTRIYIPRLILPMANMAPAVLNFSIHVAIILVAVVYYRITQGVWFLTPLGFGWAMLAVGMAMLLALGISLWTSVPAMVVRDIRFTLTYVMSFWMFLTPVLYPLPRTGRYGWMLSLNPMAAVVNMFKHGVLGLDTLNLLDVGIAMVVIAAVLGSGLWFFGRAEATAADKA